MRILSLFLSLLLPAAVQAAPAPNHLVCWLKKEVPADFLLGFQVRPEDRNRGLNIVFFNARGRGGESVFDPALLPRKGVFAQYTRGDLDNYHTSYWAGDRGIAHIRKNFGFHLVATGKELVTGSPADSFQTIRIHKRSSRIRVMVDDIVSVVFEDDGETYGSVWTHTGWIALRQMGHAILCEYDDLKNFPLNLSPNRR